MVDNKQIHRILAVIATRNWWVALVILLLSSCAPQISSEINHNTFTLTGDDIRTGGIAFVTPSTVTGQEEEKQIVAFVFCLDPHRKNGPT